MTFFQKNTTLETLGASLLDAVWAAYPGLARNQLAVTWLVYGPQFPINTGGAIAVADFWSLQPAGFSYRGLERVYPASWVKLFYLVAIAEWLERGMIQPSTELDRALRDAIVDSSNDATSYLVDLLSGTTSGPELSAGPFVTWQAQRQIVNRYLQSFNWPEFETINVCQKTWSDGPYGREAAFVGADYSNRNWLTTEAIARLLHAIIGGVAVSGPRSQGMMRLLARSLDPAAVAALDPETNQITGFLGEPLPPTARLWSKAGWTSKVRHDCAYIELPNALPYLLSVAIDSPLGDRDRSLLPFISQAVMNHMATLSATDLA